VLDLEVETESSEFTQKLERFDWSSEFFMVLRIELFQTQAFVKNNASGSPILLQMNGALVNPNAKATFGNSQ
jgi:hypothetical protein